MARWSSAISAPTASWATPRCRRSARRGRSAGPAASGARGNAQESAIGSAWTIGGSGDFLGQGHDQYMLENANGALDIGSVSNGQATYTQVGAIGSEWTLSGTGTYLGAST